MRLFVFLLILSIAPIFVPSSDVKLNQAVPNPANAVWVFPADGMKVPSNSSIVLAFPSLIDAHSVKSALNLTLQPNISVSLDLSGDCGDDSVVILKPSRGLRPGNYTMSFLNNLQTVYGVPVSAPVPNRIRFTVSGSAGLEVAGTALDSLGLSTSIEGSTNISTMAGSMYVTLAFSEEINLSKLAASLANELAASGVQHKQSECQSQTVSLSLSLSLERTVTFTLDSRDVVSYSNQTRTLTQPVRVTITRMYPLGSPSPSFNWWLATGLAAIAVGGLLFLLVLKKGFKGRPAVTRSQFDRHTSFLSIESMTLS